MSLAQEQIGEAVSMLQALLKCRSLQDVTSLQKDYMQKSFDRLVQQTNKLTQEMELMTKNKSKPLNEQLENFMRMTRAA